MRASISFGFLSAVADRLGFWPQEVAAWGNWSSFLEYTKLLNPLVPSSLINLLGIMVTLLEVLLAIFLLIGFKTSLFAKLSGVLLLLFGLGMTFTIGIKAPLDYSVFAAAATGFGLSVLKEKYLELDVLLDKETNL